MPELAKDLWSLVLNQREVDPAELADAVEDQVRRGDLDFRSRLLIRDSLDALEERWGKDRLGKWLTGSPAAERLTAIRQEELGKPGFPFLRKQLVNPSQAEAMREFLREVGLRLQRPVKLSIGGSGALILKGYLDRRTQDLDVVDEVPEEIRTLGDRLNLLEQLYHVRLSHFQSHYLPAGWSERTHSLDPFGQLQASVVDVYDVFLSKLFSIREKDLNDLRTLTPQLDRETLARRLRDTTGPMLSEAGLRQRAEQNWHTLFGGALPT
jgi:Nucleotidyltransferase of unknown function (DUF6036)